MKQIKAAIFDVDGVLLQTPHYFSIELEKRGYKNAVIELAKYYNNEHDICAIGEMDAKTAIISYLNNINWPKSVDSYFHEQYEFEKKYWKAEFIPKIKLLQQKGIKCYLATDQEKYRAEILLDNGELLDLFDGKFLSYQIGYKKTNTNFWKQVIDKLEKDEIITESGDIVFFDDLQLNVGIAKSCGIQSYLFTYMIQFENDIQQHI